MSSRLGTTIVKFTPLWLTAWTPGRLRPQQARQMGTPGNISRNDLTALARAGRGQRRDDPRHNRRVVHSDDSQADRAPGYL